MSEPVDRKHYARPHDRLQIGPSGSIDTGTPEGHSTADATPSWQVSLRTQRRIFVGSCTAMILGVLVVLLSSSYRNEFLAPGPLTSGACTNLGGTCSARCATCHEPEMPH